MEKKPQQQLAAPETAEAPSVIDLSLLSRTMEAFNNATVKLERSYELLQDEARKLKEEIQEKNSRLSYMSNLLESVLNNTHSAILVVDEGYAVLVKNSAGERMTEDLGEEAIKRMLQSAPRQGVFDYDNGGGRFFRLSVGELLSDSLSGAVFVIDEITALKKFEQEKRRSEQMALMGEMAANIAHEIRNPLGSIELFASLLDRDLEENPDAKRLTGNIVKAVRIMNGVISNTLLFTKQLRVEKNQYRLSDIVDEAVLYLQHMLREKRITVVNRLHEEHMICCDRALFYQVVTNLVHNAIDAVHKDGRISIESFMEEASVKLVVEDNGSGLPPAMRSKLFMPFQTTKAKGTGLGLSIAYKIVKAHDGDIFADSDGKSYTRFTVVMPGA